MQFIYSCLTKGQARQALVRLTQTAALAIIVALAFPARADEERDVIIRVTPTYPVLAERMKITGTVKVEATVDAKGKVLDAKGINGNRILIPAAEEAVRRWHFDTGTGTVKVEVEVGFRPSE
jgi:TonB family protein